MERQGRGLQHHSGTVGQGRHELKPFPPSPFREDLIDLPVRELGAPQLVIWLWWAESISAALTACGEGHCTCRSGSGIRSPSRSKPAPVSATARAPPHQTASGEVASSAPPTAGPRATPAVKERP